MVFRCPLFWSDDPYGWARGEGGLPAPHVGFRVPCAYKELIHSSLWIHSRGWFCKPFEPDAGTGRSQAMRKFAESGPFLIEESGVFGW